MSIFSEIRNNNKKSAVLFIALIAAGSALLLGAGLSSSANNEVSQTRLGSSISGLQYDDELRITLSGPSSSSATAYYSGPDEQNNCDYHHIESSISYFEAVGSDNVIDLADDSGGKYYCLATTILNQVIDYEPVLIKASLRDAPFNRGRIIDDDVLVNYKSMSVEDIDHFLRATVGSGGILGYGYCDRYGGRSRPTYTCLFEYQHNPQTGEDNYGLFDDGGRPLSIPGGLSAAEIIHQAAQDFEINPQVLLTILQKEQALVTSSRPNYSQFRAATGFACPDGRGCSSSAKNFYAQVRGAAWALRKYIYYQDNNFYHFRYSVGTYRIPTYPSHRPECPTVRVEIENKATAALYIYTPYVYASKSIRDEMGDQCTSNGNKNFWGFFNLYFDPATSGEELNSAKQESAIRIQPGEYDEERGGYVFELSSLKAGATVVASRSLAFNDCYRLLGVNSSLNLLFRNYTAKDELVISEEDDGRYYCLGLAEDSKLLETRSILIDYRLLSKKLIEDNQSTGEYYVL